MSRLHKFWNSLRGYTVDAAEVHALRNQLLALSPEFRNDQFISPELGMGTGRDKAEMFMSFADYRRPRSEIDGLYRTSGLIQRIVDLPINDMTRRGIHIEHDYANEIQQGLKKLRIFPKANRAGRYGRAFRFAVVFLDVNDGQPVDQPVNLKRIRSVNLATVHDSDYIQPYGFEWWDGDEPSLYLLTRSGRQSLVHRDRLMIFDGIDTGFNNRVSNSGMGESIIDAVYRPFRNLDIDYNAASTLAKDFRVPVFTLAGFEDKAKGSAKAAVDAAWTRYSTMKKMLSVVNGFVAGKDDKVEYLASQVTGYADLVQLTKDYLCFVSGIPHSKLFNEGVKAGLANGKGESEDNDWVNVVEDLQQNLFGPQLDKVIAYIAAAYKIYEPITYRFNDLNPKSNAQKQLERKTRAEAEKLEAQADLIRLNCALVTREEVRQNRYIDNVGDNADRFVVEQPKPPEYVDLPGRKPDPLAVAPVPVTQNKAVSEEPHDPTEDPAKTAAA